MRDELASTRPPTLRAERTLAARAAVVLAAVLGTLVPAIDGGAVAAPEAHWNRRFVGNAEELAVDARGNTFVVGTRRIDRYHRAIVTRYGPEGRVLWHRRWGPDRLYTQGSAIAVADDGSVIVAGTIQPEGLCGGWFVRAYGRNGERRWHREQDGARTCRQYDGVTAVDVGEDSIVIVGNEVSDGIGWVAGWIVSLSLDGRVQWRRPFDVPDVPERWYDDLSDVAIDDRGRIYVVGASARRREDGWFGSYRRVVQKLSPSGTEVWTRVFDDRDRRSTDIDRATSVSIVGDRMVVGGSITRKGWERSGAWVARFSLTGKLLTQRSRQGGKGEIDVSLTPQGRTFVAWESRNGTVLTKLGPRLAPVWSAVLPEHGTAPMVSAGGRAVSTASNASDRQYDRIWRFPD